MKTSNGVSRTLLLVAALVATACGSDVLTGPSAITGGVWRVREMQLSSLSLVAISDPNLYTVEFKTGGQLAVKADCNACGGSYLLPGGDALQIGTLACTLAACSDPTRDAAFLSILTSARTHGVDGSVLTIQASNGVLRLAR